MPHTCVPRTSGHHVYIRTYVCLHDVMMHTHMHMYIHVYAHVSITAYTQKEAEHGDSRAARLREPPIRRQGVTELPLLCGRQVATGRIMAHVLRLMVFDIVWSGLVWSSGVGQIGAEKSKVTSGNGLQDCEQLGLHPGQSASSYNRQNKRTLIEISTDRD